jgi:hypothetical protein
MIRWLAKLWAKWAYVWRLEAEAATNDISAELAARRAVERRENAEQLKAEADVLEQRITSYSEKEERGFYICENGHEYDEPPKSDPDKIPACGVCGASLMFIKREAMSGKERYESDQERKEAEKILASKRQLVEEEIKGAEGGEATARHFRGQAENGREVARRARAL